MHSTNTIIVCNRQVLDVYATTMLQQMQFRTIKRDLKGSTWMVLPTFKGVASAWIKSPSFADFKWLILSWIPATLVYPEAICAPILARDSAIIADTPPWSTPNGCHIQNQIIHNQQLFS